MKYFLSGTISLLVLSLSACTPFQGRTDKVTQANGTIYDSPSASQPKKMSSGNLKEYISVLTNALMTNNLSVANRVANAAVKDYPNNVEIKSMLIRTLISSGNLSQAENFLKTIPGQPLAKITEQARLLIAYNQPEQAIKLLNDNMANHPQDYQNRYLYAVALDLTEQHNKAQVIYQELIDQNPNDYPAYYNYGMSLLYSKQWDRSYNIFKQINQIIPQARIPMAIDLIRMGEVDSAKKLLLLSLSESEAEKILETYQK